mgnify:CR=1 FL=1
MKASKKNETLRREQELAWIGDTVLDLFARSWILEHHGTVSGEHLQRLTSNQFLSCFGNPTSVEAKIGQVYHAEGLRAAFDWIRIEILPLFEKQERNRR